MKPLERTHSEVRSRGWLDYVCTVNSIGCKLN